jgi:pyrimidine oxygenase
LTFDDFLVGVEDFGQKIQPLMRSRSNIALNVDLKQEAA